MLILNLKNIQKLIFNFKIKFSNFFIFFLIKEVTKKFTDVITFKKRRTILKVLISYFVLIIIFTFLMMTPLAWVSWEWSNFLDTLFIATSAFTTTGLTLVNIGKKMTLFGQILIFLLIIFGGLGLLFFKLILFKFLLFFLKNKDKKLEEEQEFEKGYFHYSKTRKMMFVSFGTLLFIQMIGFLLFFFYFYNVEIKEMTKNSDYSGYEMFGNFQNSFWSSLFYSVSATNNAGFDLLPNNESLSFFEPHVYIQFVFIFLFVLGGIGFPIFLFIWEKIVKFKKRIFNKEKIFYSSSNKFLIKFLLFSYVFVVFFSLASILISESLYIEKINQDEEIIDFIMRVLFNTFSTRSAGFSTVDIKSKFNPISHFLFSIYMWIGSNPLSTGGGIKTTSFIILIFSIFLFKDKNNNLIVGKRSISSLVVGNVFKTFFLSIFFMFMAIIIFQTSKLYGDKFNFLDILFFTTSSFGNVGLSTINIIGKKDELGISFKIASIFLMLIGQIGLINFVKFKSNRINTNIIYIPSEIPT